MQCKQTTSGWCKCGMAWHLSWCRSRCRSWILPLVMLRRVSIYTGICHYTDKITVSHLFWCVLLLLIISSFSPPLFFRSIFFFFVPYKIFRFEILFGMVGLVWCVSSHRVHNSLIYYIYKIWRNSVVAFLQCVWLFNFCSAFPSKTDGINVVGRHKQNRPNGVFVYIYASFALIQIFSHSSRILSTLAVWGSICLCIHFVFT